MYINSNLCLNIEHDYHWHINMAPTYKNNKIYKYYSNEQSKSYYRPAAIVAYFFGSSPKFSRICSKKRKVNTVWGPSLTKAGMKPWNKTNQHQSGVIHFKSNDFHTLKYLSWLLKIKKNKFPFLLYMFLYTRVFFIFF